MFRVLMILALAFALGGCASKFQTYDGPEVTRVMVNKSARKMYLLHHNAVLKSYDVGLGFAPEGDKQFEGDGKTPEGEYTIDRRNPNSRFYLSLGIDYPRLDDVQEAMSFAQSPGGDIFIHGRPWKYRKGGRDWTWGCIAVTNREMREIYAMVKNGTPITINP
ncbi:L,D-transpeptidase family protein [Marivita hallyeonensis]|uniref:L,D-transpeptidase catalytic domain n=1 Tax=Marivita hallyeonensis TaxID=996342 RepID=A0A1M5UBI7_9RHOB|nr:L,D-transpeptidase family protein [Marivita hallyeonensis]SHH60300.1 L,D-transpeptidase catalytic domain [Marivita hallyeonensis]